MNNSSSLLLTINMLSRSQGIAWIVVFSLEALVIIIANTATLAVFITSKYIRKRSTYCLINLSIADLLIGGVPMPLWIYLIGAYHRVWVDSWSFTASNMVYFLVDQVCAFASIFCLVLLSLERIYATIAPLHHRKLPGVCYVLAILFVWLFSSAVSLTSFLSLFVLQNKALSTYVPMIAISLSVVLLCLAYSSIWMSFRMNSFERRSLCNRAMVFDRKLAKTLFIVTAVSLVTWLPFVIVSMSASFYNIGFDFHTVLAVKLLHYTNSLINPVIYTFRMREFRRAMLCLFKTRGESNLRREKMSFLQKHRHKDRSTTETRL